MYFSSIQVQENELVVVIDRIKLDLTKLLKSCDRRFASIPLTVY